MNRIIFEVCFFSIFIFYWCLLLFSFLWVNNNEILPTQNSGFSILRLHHYWLTFGMNHYWDNLKRVLKTWTKPKCYCTDHTLLFLSASNLKKAKWIHERSMRLTWRVERTSQKKQWRNTSTLLPRKLHGSVHEVIWIPLHLMEVFAF